MWHRKPKKFGVLKQTLQPATSRIKVIALGKPFFHWTSIITVQKLWLSWKGRTYCGRSWLCLWLLMGGRTDLLLISSPFLRASLICSVSVWTIHKYSWQRHSNLSQLQNLWSIGRVWPLVFKSAALVLSTPHLCRTACVAVTQCKCSCCRPHPREVGSSHPRRTWHWPRSG